MIVAPETKLGLAVVIVEADTEKLAGIGGAPAVQFEPHVCARRAASQYQFGGVTVGDVLYSYVTGVTTCGDQLATDKLPDTGHPPHVLTLNSAVELTLTSWTVGESR